MTEDTSKDFYREGSTGPRMDYSDAPVRHTHVRRDSKIQIALEALRKRRQETIMEMMSKPQKIE